MNYCQNCGMATKSKIKWNDESFGEVFYCCEKCKNEDLEWNSRLFKPKPVEGMVCFSSKIGELPLVYNEKDGKIYYDITPKPIIKLSKQERKMKGIQRKAELELKKLNNK